MALHCDIRFVASDAKLGQPEIRIGFIPPIATTQALARLIGRPRAIRYLYEGRMITAQEALDWDMVGELVAPEKLRERVQVYALDLAAKSPAALAAIRRTITLGGGMDYDAGMEFEMKAVGEVASGPDFREGVAAFLEKRPAKWRFES
jgi:enoyl-CoA hydratase